MSPAARWTSFLLLPAVAVLDGLAWYGMRVVMPSLYLQTAADDTHAIYMTMSVVGFLGTAIAAALAIPKGGLLPLAIGVFLTLAGIVAAVILPPGSAQVGGYLAAFGHGLVRPSLFGTAALAFGRSYDAARASLFVTVYAAVNLAAFGSSGFSSISRELGGRAAMGTAATVAAVALVLVAAVGIVAIVTRKKAPPPDPAPRSGALAAAAVIAVVVGLVWSTTSFAHEIPYRFYSVIDVEPVTWSSSLAAVCVGALVAIAVGLVHFTSVRVPFLAVAGAGMLIAAVATLVLALVDESAPSEGALIGGMILLGAGEILVYPMVLAHVTGAVPWRFTTAAAAFLSLMVSLPSIVLPWVSDSADLARGATWAGVVSMVPVGIALIVASFALRRVLAPTE